MATPLVVQPYKPSPGNEKPGYYGPPTPGTETAPFSAPGVPPQTSNPTTSGTGTSPGNGGSSTQPFGANVPPSVKKNFQIKEKLLRPALTSHYQCWFNPPEKVINWIKTYKKLDYYFNKELISLSCSEASLPGSSFMTNEITDDYTGVTERHAYRRTYDDRIDFTFYVDHGRSDGNYNVLWFFEKWMQYIAVEEENRGLEDRNFHYRFRFPEDYQTDNLFINKFERDLAGQYLQYKFMQAYPISINSIPVSYDSSQLLKVTVSFTYTRYLTERSGNTVEKEPSQTPATGVPKVPVPPTTFQGNPTFTNPQVSISNIQPTATLGLNPGQINPGSGGLVN
jgi:hypothetical protein